MADDIKEFISEYTPYFEEIRKRLFSLVIFFIGTIFVYLNIYE